jgi:hypothetical protein
VAVTRARDGLACAIETILVDCYNEDEQYMAFLTVLDSEVRLPTPALVLGTPVTVTKLDYTDVQRGLVARCRGTQGAGEVALTDLTFAADRLAPGCTPLTASISG